MSTYPESSLLARCLGEPGYTPPQRALVGLVGALLHVHEDECAPLERALERAGAPALAAALTVLQRSSSDERPRLLALLVRLVPHAAATGGEALYAAFGAALTEPVVQSRKLAARGLGKLGDRRAEPLLLRALAGVSVTEQKRLVDALGLLGGAATLEALPTLPTSDEDLVRRAERARLLIERRGARRGDSALVFDRRLVQTTRVALSCRAGLAGVLCDELAGKAPRVSAPDRVELEHAGTLADLLTARTALEVSLVVPLAAANGETPEQRIAEALTRPETLQRLGAWTRGRLRFRVAWSDGAHHRALTWALAREVRARDTALMNDSHAAPWSVWASPDGHGELQLVPRLDPDPRFPYRVSDVPAASHPTIAAALARIAGARSDDVVWDPFVGSALELCECARLGPVRQLWGTDIDPRALVAARANLSAAGVPDVQLLEASALEFAPPGVSLILSNPPMGRRVARDGSIGGLLEAFVQHAAHSLRPSGRLVWLSPLEHQTARAGKAHGLLVVAGPSVDMGGFSARVQLMTRPA